MAYCINMNETLKKLEELVERYSNSLSATRNEIESLEKRASLIGSKIETLREVMKEIAAVDSKGKSVLVGIGKYSNMPLSKAILDVVNLWGTPPGLLTPEVMTKLQAEGFQSRAKKLYASVYSVAQSLVKSGKIDQGERDGKRSFMRKSKEK